MCILVYLRCSWFGDGGFDEGVEGFVFFDEVEVAELAGLRVKVALAGFDGVYLVGDGFEEEESLLDGEVYHVQRIRVMAVERAAVMMRGRRMARQPGAPVMRMLYFGCCILNFECWMLLFAFVADDFVVDALEDGGVGVFVFGAEGFCRDAVADVFDGAACFAQLAVELGVGVGCDVWVVVGGVHDWI